MANVTINTLTELSSEPLGASFIPIWESGATKKVSITNLLSGYLPLSGGTLTVSVSLPNGTAAAPSLYWPSVGIGLYKGAGTSMAFAYNNNAVINFGGTQMRFAVPIEFSSSAFATSDIAFSRASAGVLEIRAGTTAQESRIYGTYTDASNYERLAIRTAAGAYTIAAEASGTGTKRNIVFDGANRGAFIDPPSSGTDGEYEAIFGSILAILESHGLMAGA